MTKSPHNVGFGDHDRTRNITPDSALRTHTRRQLLADLFKAWLTGGSKGTKPRKARIGQSKARSVQTRERAGRDRVKRRMTKAIQQVRMARGQNVRKGS